MIVEWTACCLLASEVAGSFMIVYSIYRVWLCWFATHQSLLVGLFGLVL
jgi:hypothetical protein